MRRNGGSATRLRWCGRAIPSRPCSARCRGWCAARRGCRREPGARPATLRRRGKLKYGSRPFNGSAARAMRGGMCTVGCNYDGAKLHEAGAGEVGFAAHYAIELRRVLDDVVSGEIACADVRIRPFRPTAPPRARLLSGCASGSRTSGVLRSRRSRRCAAAVRTCAT